MFWELGWGLILRDFLEQFGAHFGSPRAPKKVQLRCKNLSFSACSILVHFELHFWLPKDPQMGPRCSQMVPKGSQMAPKWPKMDPKGSKLHPNGSPMASDAPNGSQMAAIGPPNGPYFSK